MLWDWEQAVNPAKPLGLTVVGGLVVSQCLTLYITPVVYLYLERFNEWTTRKRTNPATVQTQTHPTA